MASTESHLFVISPQLNLRGELKTRFDVLLQNDFHGQIKTSGSVTIPAGFVVKADVTSASFHLAAGTDFAGILHIGEARKPLQSLRRWLTGGKRL